MLKRLLPYLSQYRFFWGKPPKQSLIKQMQEATQKAQNLGHLVKRILQENKSKPKLLPIPDNKNDNNNKLTVVLQLDQVLIYTFTPDQDGYLLAPMRPYDFYKEMDQYDALMSIYKRKNLDNFLNYLVQQCQPIIWTCGIPQYAQIIMNLIDPQRRIKHIITQQKCDQIIVQDENIDQFLKDLNLLGRDLNKVVYLDSKPLSYWIHPDSCLPLEQFRADQTMKNQDLNLIIPQLQRLRKEKDVRQELIKKFNIRSILEQSKLL